jgi:hypothetical protein
MTVVGAAAATSNQRAAGRAEGAASTGEREVKRPSEVAIRGQTCGGAPTESRTQG